MPPRKAAAKATAGSKRKQRSPSVESAVSDATSERSDVSSRSSHSDDGKRPAKKVSQKKTATTKRGGARNKLEVTEESEPAVVTTPAPTPTPEPAEVAPVAEAAPAAPPPPMPTPAADETVPLAAVVAMDVDRSTEADHGLLKEPGPPREGISRVTVEGVAAPALPTELLQLLSG